MLCLFSQSLWLPNKQLADNHQVTVSNPIAGYATETTLQSIDGKVGESAGVFDGFEQATSGMTQADASITLSQQVKSFDIQNTGDSIVYVNFDTAATTAHIAIDPGMTMSRSLKVTAIHGICDAGLTSTLRVVGYF